MHLPGAAFGPFVAEHDANVFEGTGPCPREVLLEGVKDAEILICTLSDKIDKEVLKAGKQLRVVANFAVGTNNIDLDWATLRDITVLNTPYVLTDATADLAFGLLLDTARQISRGDRLIRAGQWNGWSSIPLTAHITGKTLGIVGLGRIGRAVAKRAQGFKMELLYHNRHRLPLGVERELGAHWRPLHELMQQSDFVSLHCPLTKHPRHIIDADALKQCRPHAILINTSRGEVIDEQALISALQQGQIAGAGLDVFEDEPHVPDALLHMEQVVLTPHIGSATQDTRDAMTNRLLQGIQSTLHNVRPSNLVNLELYPSKK
jgi:glyoxylate reductase